jgi:hypothetical protein
VAVAQLYHDCQARQAALAQCAANRSKNDPGR